MNQKGPRAVVIGGGVIGLAVARELEALEFNVTVLERRQFGREASYAAAGMLAPELEFTPDDELFTMASESLALYPDFAATLEAEVSQIVDLRLSGIVRPLMGSPAAGEVGESEATHSYPSVERLEGNALRRLEPELANEFTTAELFHGHGSVDNRALVDALARSCQCRGVELRAATTATEVTSKNDRVTGVITDGGPIAADMVVNCAGAWASDVAVDGAAVATHPVKGQMLLVRCPQPVLEHVIYSHLVYLVPRSDGRVVVGTTVEERGYNKDVEAWALERLLKGALTVCPALKESRFVEAWAGLRPQIAQKSPQICAAGPLGYFLACGHYRNGVLLAPITAKRVAALVRQASD